MYVIASCNNELKRAYPENIVKEQRPQQPGTNEETKGIDLSIRRSKRVLILKSDQPAKMQVLDGTVREGESQQIVCHPILQFTGRKISSTMMFPQMRNTFVIK